MIGVKSVFSVEELDFMKSTIGIELSDDTDYSDDDLLELHEQITEELPHDYDSEGNPLDSGRLFESIVDKFYDKFDI